MDNCKYTSQRNSIRLLIHRSKMSHEGKMRRGEISNDPNNADRIYFLEQSKPKEEVKEKKVKKVKKDVN